ncbi:MAG: hypothetical protein RLZZ292_1928 [Bacteroidota bacterium]
MDLFLFYILFNVCFQRIPMTYTKKICLTLGSFFLFAYSLFAQHTVLPASWSAKNPIQRVAPIAKLPSLNVAKLEDEDRRSGNHNRFAAPIDVDYSPENSGDWTTLPDGQQLWQLHIKSSGAYALTLLYDYFHLPEGAQLWVYDEAKHKVVGNYTAADNTPKNIQLTGLIYSDAIVIEYLLPANIPQTTQSFHIHKIYHAYQRELSLPQSETGNVAGGPAGTGFGKSSHCNININCPDGANWQQHKHAAVRIMMVLAEGMGWCTGNLMNNTAEDGKPYLLTAFHCKDGYTPLYDYWTFDFNYEFQSCTSSNIEPPVNRLVGCAQRAGRQQSDFLLLELTSAIPTSYTPYFYGWNRDANFIPTNTYQIHHAKGDVKKLTFDTNNTAIINASTIKWNNNVTTPSYNHYRVAPNKGVLEIGSSGSALLDENGLVIGQFNGGLLDSCFVTKAYHGRFASSWENGSTPETRLREWLDPLNTGVVTLGGTNTPTSKNVIKGKLTNHNGKALKYAKVFATYTTNGNLQVRDSVFTDTAGVYTLNTLNFATSVTIRPSKNSNAKNGVSTLDVVKAKRHVLNIDTIKTDWQLLAADANFSGKVSTIDIVEIHRVVLEINAQFPNGESWRFLPRATITGTYDTTLKGYTYPLTNTPQLIDKQDFMGIKTGDIDGSADPNK